MFPPYPVLSFDFSNSFHGCTSSPKFPIPRRCFPEDSFKNDKYLHLYGLEKGTMGTGHLKMFQGRRDTLFSGIRDILWETEHGKRDTISSDIRTTYPLGIENLGIGI